MRTLIPGAVGLAAWMLIVSLASLTRGGVPTHEASALRGQRPSSLAALYEGATAAGQAPYDNEHPTFGPDGNIYFRTNRSGNPDIYRMAPDGTDQTPFITSPGDEYPPRWSPDGDRGAFMSDRSGDWEIYAIDLAGESVVRLTDRPGRDWDPEWAPDGRRIAFMREEDPAAGHGSWQIWVMDADGSDAKALVERQTPNYYPRWVSRERLIFVSARSGTAKIYITSLLDKSARPIESGDLESYQPVLSPDGSSILFGSRRDGNLDLYIVGVDGSNVRRVTDHPGRDKDGTWSPDGAWIWFSSNRTGHSEIYRIRPDGEGLEPITEQAGPAPGP